ncbi:MAG: nitrite reductase (NADH) large subunit [Psychromonas sp.]
MGTARRGGITINNQCITSDPDIFAISECASWNDKFFGLVAPGYNMAKIAVDTLFVRENEFSSADMSAKLKLLFEAVLVGDTESYSDLLQYSLNSIELPKHPDSLILPAHAGAKSAGLGVDALLEMAQLCSCFEV